MTMGRVKWWVAVASALALVVASSACTQGMDECAACVPVCGVGCSTATATCHSCVPTCADDAGMAMCVGGIHGAYECSGGGQPTCVAR